MPDEADLEHVRPYADHHGDGVVQLSFTLPVPDGLAARKAALELAGKMGFQQPEVVHHQRLTDGYSYFVLYGHCVHTVDYATLAAEGGDIAQYMTEDEVEAYAQEHIQRPVVVVGASTGTDTHSVGIDAMLNLKGFHGHKGLEGYRAFHAHNLGSQVPNSALVARAIELDADAILVSQTVTQQNLHIHNLTELVEIVEAEGRRRRADPRLRRAPCLGRARQGARLRRRLLQGHLPPPPRDLPRARARRAARAGRGPVADRRRGTGQLG